MNYVRRRRKQPEAASPKRNNGEEVYEFTQGEGTSKIALLKQLAAYKKEVDEIKNRINSASGERVKQEEDYTGIDDKKLSDASLLTVNQRHKLEAQVARCKHMLEHKETAIGADYGSKGGKTSCFVRNDLADARCALTKLMRAKRALHFGSHGKLSPADVSKLLTQKKHFEKVLKDTLPSISDCNSKNKSTELSIYLEKHEKKYGKMMLKLQNINKTLEPDNPNAGSLRYLWKD